MNFLDVREILPLGSDNFIFYIFTPPSFCLHILIVTAQAGCDRIQCVTSGLRALLGNKLRCLSKHLVCVTTKTSTGGPCLSVLRTSGKSIRAPGTSILATGLNRSNGSYLFTVCECRPRCLTTCTP